MPWKILPARYLNSSLPAGLLAVEPEAQLAAGVAQLGTEVEQPVVDLPVEPVHPEQEKT